MHYRNKLIHCQTLKILRLYQSYSEPMGFLPVASMFSMKFQHIQNGVLIPGEFTVTIDAREFILYLKQLAQQGIFDTSINTATKNIEYFNV
jgi:hypothetical protein